MPKTPKKTTVVVDMAWLHQVDEGMAMAIADIQRAIAQLEFKSNARFIEQRGRTTLALDKLRSAEQRLVTARTPWII